MATVKDTHTRLCICALRKIILIFFVSTFHGEVLGKCRESHLPLTGVTSFNRAIGSRHYLSLGRQLVQKRGKICNIDPD